VVASRRRVAPRFTQHPTAKAVMCAWAKRLINHGRYDNAFAVLGVMQLLWDFCQDSILWETVRLNSSVKPLACPWCMSAFLTAQSRQRFPLRQTTLRRNARLHANAACASDGLAALTRVLACS